MTTYGLMMHSVADKKFPLLISESEINAAFKTLPEVTPSVLLYQSREKKNYVLTIPTVKNKMTCLHRMPNCSLSLDDLQTDEPWM